MFPHILPLLALSIISMSATPPRKEHRLLDPALQRYVEEQVLPAVQHIDPERRAVLADLAAFVSERRAAGMPVELVFICTHNSRRSHLGQLWAATAAWYHGFDGVRTYSGGTEATAFNPRAVAALRRAGFTIDAPEGPNPHYAVRFAEGAPVQTCYSKTYDDPANPQQGFCAVMTCSHADANCPIVRGALDRLSLPYDDPKEADGTPEEAARYDERSLQIAAELFHAFSLVQH